MTEVRLVAYLSRPKAHYDIPQVSEEVVLNDAAGLHLSAGPYFLIYSAALTEEEENAPMPWPTYLKVHVC